MKKFILIILLLLTTSNYTKAYELKATVSEIENELKSLIKPLRQAKIETVKYYRQDEPKSYSVVIGTDLIKDYIKDIKTLLEK